METNRGTLLEHGVRLFEQLPGGGAAEQHWLARHDGLQSDVLVRICAARTMSGRALCEERFHREAKASDRLDSPHVTRVLAQGTAPDGAPYLVTELLDGETLANRLRRGPLPIDELLAVVRQTASVIDAAHEQGILHGNVEPGHIFLLSTAAGRTVVKLSLGVATDDEGPALESLEGMPAQLAPAYLCRDLLLDPHDLGPYIDLWSLGVVAYEGLTGARPFPGDSPQAIAAALMDLRFTPPSELRAELGPDCDALFEQVFHRERVPRPSSGSAFVADLHEALRGAMSTPQTTATSAPLAEPTQREKRKALQAWLEQHPHATPPEPPPPPEADALWRNRS